MLNTYVVYVENKPGVLTRVASLFRRRAFNIDSLTVGRTEKPEVSRMTITVDADPRPGRASRLISTSWSTCCWSKTSRTSRRSSRPGHDQSRGHS
jgi:acetolactate synthase regulatory subunit